MVTTLVAALLLALPAGAAAQTTYLPPAGKIFSGVAFDPISAYTTYAGKHPAIYQEFVAWGQWLPGITQDAVSARARMMMMITTMYGAREAITPEGIARGNGDAWLIGLNRAIAASNNITYIRLMAEMNNVNNPYSDCGHGAGNSSRWYRQAWRRVTLIMRGGPLAHIDAVLKRLRLPALHTGSDLPKPRVSMMWVPMVAANCGPSTAAYWPGSAWVDWVGTDFYSKFPNWAGLNAFYSAYGGKPFAFGEYALWGGDNPGFINELFRWTYTHPRTRMLVYNQGGATNGPFRLKQFPAGASALRHQLASPRILAFAPEWAS